MYVIYIYINTYHDNYVEMRSLHSVLKVMTNMSFHMMPSRTDILQYYVDVMDIDRVLWLAIGPFTHPLQGWTDWLLAHREYKTHQNRK